MAEIVPLHPRFDPDAPGAERRYDTVVARLNRIAAERRRLARACAELARQFVENDLVSTRAGRRGAPLGPRGRRQRLARLLEGHAGLRELERDWTRWHGELERMNRALDAWARENWGAGASE